MDMPSALEMVRWTNILVTLIICKWRKHGPRIIFRQLNSNITEFIKYSSNQICSVDYQNWKGFRMRHCVISEEEYDTFYIKIFLTLIPRFEI